MRLIDADELKIYISTTFCDTCKRDKGVCSSCEFDDVFIAIEDAPTIDAEPVVRCKDCRHNEWCIPKQGRSENDYCSRGERREP